MTIYLEALHVLERIDRGAPITSLTPDELMTFAGAILHLQHVGLRYVGRHGRHRAVPRIRPHALPCGVVMPTQNVRGSRTKYPQLCVSCQRPFGRGSRPLPVFREDYRVLGKAHVTCAQRNGLRVVPWAKTIIQAQFSLWISASLERPQRDLDLHYAELLASVYGLNPPEPFGLMLQLASIIAWEIQSSIVQQESWPGDFGPERIAGIIDEYPRVIQRFREEVGPLLRSPA